MSIQVQIIYFKMPTLGGGEKLTLTWPPPILGKLEFSSVRVGFLSSRKIGSVSFFNCETQQVPDGYPPCITAKKRK
jgi:hypothetical protein